MAIVHSNMSLVLQEELCRQNPYLFFLHHVPMSLVVLVHGIWTKDASVLTTGWAACSLALHYIFVAL